MAEYIGYNFRIIFNSTDHIADKAKSNRKSVDIVRLTGLSHFQTHVKFKQILHSMHADKRKFIELVISLGDENQ